MGTFGISESTAGLFLAYHFSHVGQYFGDMEGNNWPHTPLHKDPTNLEYTLNDYMIRVSKVAGEKILF